MKIRLTLLRTIALALPLVVAIPPRLLGQNTNAVTPAPATSRSTGDFTFPGGSPRDFLAAIEKRYQVDWLSIASIPAELGDVRVPRLRIPDGLLALGLEQGGASGAAFDAMQIAQGGDSNPFAAKLWGIVTLYNRLAEHEPQLGTLVVEADPFHPEKPYAVMLVPDKRSASAQDHLRIKAFPLRGIPESQWSKLEEDIARAKDVAAGVSQRGETAFAIQVLKGVAQIHRETNLLVAYGPESFVEMVDSIVAAYQANQRLKESKSGF